MLTVVLFVVGIGLLIAGAELLVRGASQLAIAAGISPLVVGLTVVAFGTGSPELAVSIGSVFSGQADLALGNVVGSNIANILLILGLAALAAPLHVSPQLVRLDLWLMIGASLLLVVLSLDGSLGRFDGALMVLGLVAYTVRSIMVSRRATAKEQALADEALEVQTVPARPWWMQVVMVGGGLGLLILGANWLVGGAVAFATYLGVSELIIGLTIVAIGTSLPEIAISVIASLRGERDIAVGNVIGSNIFNILGVLGLVAVLAPGGMRVAPAMISFDLPVMIGVALACVPIFLVRYEVTRGEGALLLGYYGCYLAYVALHAAESATLPTVRAALGLVALPLTAVVLMVRLARHRAQRLPPHREELA